MVLPIPQPASAAVLREMLRGALVLAALAPLAGCVGAGGGAGGSDGIVGYWKLTGTIGGAGPYREYIAIMSDGSSDWPMAENGGFVVDVAGDLSGDNTAWTFSGTFDNEDESALSYEIKGGRAELGGSNEASFEWTCNGTCAGSDWEFEGARCAEADWWHDCE